MPQLLLCVIFGDFLIYWEHRLMHAVTCHAPCASGDAIFGNSFTMFVKFELCSPWTVVRSMGLVPSLLVSPTGIYAFTSTAGTTPTTLRSRGLGVSTHAKPTHCYPTFTPL